MKNYTIYKKNGEILRSGICQEIDYKHQCVNDEYIIDIASIPGYQYIEDGQVVDMPEKPDGKAYFDFDAKQWVLDNAAQEQSVKLQRLRLLQESDWTQLPDVPLETKTAWSQYRQDLRNITTQEGYPFEIMWPAKPE